MRNNDKDRIDAGVTMEEAGIFRTTVGIAHLSHPGQVRELPETLDDDCSTQEGSSPSRRQALLIDRRSAAAATASLSAGAGARSHDWIPQSRSSSDARSSRFMLLRR